MLQQVFFDFRKRIYTTSILSINSSQYGSANYLIFHAIFSDLLGGEEMVVTRICISRDDMRSDSSGEDAV